MIAIAKLFALHANAKNFTFLKVILFVVFSRNTWLGNVKHLTIYLIVNIIKDQKESELCLLGGLLP